MERSGDGRGREVGLGEVEENWTERRDSDRFGAADAGKGIGGGGIKIGDGDRSDAGGVGNGAAEGTVD